MSALLLSLGLAVEPGLSAFPGQTGLQSYAAENTIEQEKASSSNLSIGYLGGEESISLTAETGDEENEEAAKGGR